MPTKRNGNGSNGNLTKVEKDLVQTARDAVVSNTGSTASFTGSIRKLRAGEHWTQALYALGTSLREHCEATIAEQPDRKGPQGSYRPKWYQHPVWGSFKVLLTRATREADRTYTTVKMDPKKPEQLIIEKVVPGKGRGPGKKGGSKDTKAAIQKLDTESILSSLRSYVRTMVESGHLDAAKAFRKRLDAELATAISDALKLAAAAGTGTDEPAAA